MDVLSTTQRAQKVRSRPYRFEASIIIKDLYRKSCPWPQTFLAQAFQDLVHPIQYLAHNLATFKTFPCQDQLKVLAGSDNDQQLPSEFVLERTDFPGRKLAANVDTQWRILWQRMLVTCLRANISPFTLANTIPVPSKSEEFLTCGR